MTPLHSLPGACRYYANLFGLESRDGPVTRVSQTQLSTGSTVSDIARTSRLRRTTRRTNAPLIAFTSHDPYDVCSEALLRALIDFGGGRGVDSLPD